MLFNVWCSFDVDQMWGIIWLDLICHLFCTGQHNEIINRNELTNNTNTNNYNLELGDITF